MRLHGNSQRPGSADPLGNVGACSHDLVVGHQGSQSVDHDAGSQRQDDRVRANPNQVALHQSKDQGKKQGH